MWAYNRIGCVPYIFHSILYVITSRSLYKNVFLQSNIALLFLLMYYIIYEIERRPVNGETVCLIPYVLNNMSNGRQIYRVLSSLSQLLL